MIGIVDYGLGNLASVAGAVSYLGHECIITSSPDELGRADKLILPGVGAFGDGMRHLRSKGLVDPLNHEALVRRKPILGICLGAQLIARSSEEFGEHAGLGWIEARVVQLRAREAGLAIPHTGWNDLHQRTSSLLFEGVPNPGIVYYVHSFHVVPADDAVVVGDCDYGGRFAAVLESRNIFATQFHPEKSQRDGLRILGNFLERA